MQRATSASRRCPRVARIDGQPAPKLSVSLQAAADEKRSARLNDTDKLGATSGWVSALGKADLRFSARSGMTVATLPKAALLAPGADLKLELEFRKNSKPTP